MTRGRFLAAAATALAFLVASQAAAPVASADTSPVPGLPFSSCLPEQYPGAGSPRDAAPVPYEIPFTATLGPAHQPPSPLPTPPPIPAGGGYFQIAHSPLVTTTLGGPILNHTTPGSMYARSCGLLQLPSQAGSIAGNPYGAGSANPTYNNHFVFDNPIPVSIDIKGIPGLPLISGYTAAEGELRAQIDPTPAPNGALNIEFYVSAKTTSDLGPALGQLLSIAGLPGITLPGSISSLINGVGVSTGNECTVPVGNLADDGIPAADLAAPAGGVSPVTGLSYQQETSPVHFTTQTSGSLQGRPITGPITNAQALLVSNDFPVAAIDPNTAPSPDAPGASTHSPSSLCSPSNAKLLNQLFDLPSPPGYNFFYAPASFAIHTAP